MGEQTIRRDAGQEMLRRFTRRVLEDLETLEHLLEENRFESDTRRIGAEQELCLVDREWLPAAAYDRMLAALDDPHFTCEIGRFNLEINLDPIELTGHCFTDLERDLEGWMGRAREAADRLELAVVLTGILPTLRLSHLGLDSMTPEPRYEALDQATRRLRGDDYSISIRGLDEVTLEHANVMLEACNTSFQVHYQVTPEEFASTYNAAQAAAGPVLAAAVNSPMLFGKRLWAETRIPLFQQSVDTRTSAHPARRDMPRVAFGDGWIERSVLEIYREDVARFPALLAPTEAGEERANTPTLASLQAFNGTVYRWNRPCYGLSGSRPHLRIENRYLPAGPTVTDEIANAAFWCGLVAGLRESHPHIDREMPFERARDNFVRAAREGLASRLEWIGGDPVPADELILSSLMPLARSGLERLGVDAADGERFLAIVHERVSRGRTGARWILESAEALASSTPGPADLAVLTEAMHDRQRDGEPVARWPLAAAPATPHRGIGHRLVQDCMTRDPFTVRREQVVDLAACLMEWRQIRHVPVEDSDHRLVGLVTYRSLLSALSERKSSAESASRSDRAGDDAVSVGEVMLRDVVTIEPEATMADAARRMLERGVGCLPVVEDGLLVGIISERDFLAVAESSNRRPQP